MLERSAEVKFQGKGGGGMHGQEGLGWEGWWVVVVPGGWGWGKTQYWKHVNSIPNGPEPPFRWPP